MILCFKSRICASTQITNIMIIFYVYNEYLYGKITAMMSRMCPGIKRKIIQLADFQLVR